MITKTDKELTLQNLSASDWDVDQELTELESLLNRPDLPRLCIEHHQEGKHRFYIDYGESYLAGKRQFSVLRVQTPCQPLSLQSSRSGRCGRREQSIPAVIQ